MTEQSCPQDSNTNNFFKTFMHYTIPPLAGAIAIIPAFHGMRVKSSLQIEGGDLATIKQMESLKLGLRAAPTVGLIVGAQMITQEKLEKTLFKEKDVYSKLASSAMVGAISSPLLAYFNHQTLAKGKPFVFATRIGLALTVQETAFVAALSGVDKVSFILKGVFGDNKATEYAAAYIIGGAGSIIGHPANTALTRWQNNLSAGSVKQLSYGLMTKAKATATFTLGYKVLKDVATSF